MGRVYHQLDRAERWRIARLRGEGCSARQIAAALDRAPSTIAAELKRNARSDGALRPGLRRGAGAGAQLARRAAGARGRVARAGAGDARRGPLDPAGRRAAQARGGAHADLARAHLPLQLRADRAHQGLPLEAAAAGAVGAPLPRTARRGTAEQGRRAARRRPARTVRAPRADAAPQYRPRRPAPRRAPRHHPRLQQHPTQVPRLPDPRRSAPRPTVPLAA